MDYATLLVDRRDGVDWVTLNRPHALNAITVQMVADLSDYFGRLFHDSITRVVVLRGAGKAFCAGLDIKARLDINDRAEGGHEAAPFAGGYGFQGFLADVYLRMRRAPQPIVSLIHGPACGGGFSFALASDIRLAGETARMNAAYIRIGLSACDMGCSYFLPRLVGGSVAAELMLTGRFLGAQRALALGLVAEVVPDDQLEAAAGPWIEDLLHASPMGLRMTKEGLNLAIDAPSLEAAMAIENRNQLLTSASPDFREGMAAFLEKRRPDYSAG